MTGERTCDSIDESRPFDVVVEVRFTFFGRRPAGLNAAHVARQRFRCAETRSRPQQFSLPRPESVPLALDLNAIARQQRFQICPLELN